MGKGARNRKEPGRGRPRGELADYMAPDVTMPPPDTQAGLLRIHHASSGGRVLLLEYLAAVDDGADVPDVLVAPNVAEELMHIRPADAPWAVREIMRVAEGWWTASGYSSLLAPHVPTMETLLDALMPPERRERARDPLKVAGTVGLEGEPVDLERARLRFVGGASMEPFEGLHLACAFATALYQVPECVPDRKEAVRELAQSVVDMLGGGK
jgi:hypothetical protein